MSIYNLRPYIGNIPMIGGYNLSPYTLDPLWKQFGAVAYYDFTDESRIQQGATAVDVAGWDNTANPGTLDLFQNTAAAQPVFDTDHIVFGASKRLITSSIIDTSDKFTVIFKMKNTGGFFPVIINNRESESDIGGFWIFLSSTPGVITVKGSGTTSISANTGSTFLDAVTDIAVVFDGPTVSIYRDGSFITSGNLGVITTPSLPIQLGGFTFANDFLGQMYKIPIFDRALTASEIKDISASL